MVIDPRHLSDRRLRLLSRPLRSREDRCLPEAEAPVFPELSGDRPTGQRCLQPDASWVQDLPVRRVCRRRNLHPHRDSGGSRRRISTADGSTLCSCGSSTPCSVSLPSFLILTVVALLGPSILNIMVVIGITSWMGTSRFVRAEFLSLRERDFVQAARASG